MIRAVTRTAHSARPRRHLIGPAIAIAIGAALLLQSPALAVTGRAAGTGFPRPDGAALIAAAGPVCIADSANFRVWWSDTPGSPIALAGADGSCATVPVAAAETLAVAQIHRGQSIGLTYPALVGDAPPRFAAQTAAFRQLRRLAPAVRAATLRRLTPLRRGRLFAGLTKPQRRIVLAGLPAALVRRINQERIRAEKGRPADFIGGDRRLDIALHATRDHLGSADGVMGCRSFALSGGRAQFASVNGVVLTIEPAANRTTLAHELFHAVQCIMGVTGQASLLLKEGTAEWHAAVLEPVMFAGAVTPTPGGAAASGGASRAISFCNDFNPARTQTLDPYTSWPVWMALELAQPGTIAGLLRSAAATPLTTPQAVVTAVGDPRWSAALATAVREVCGNLRSPNGQTAFPAGIRDFFATAAPTASPGTPAVVTVPAGGTASVRAAWSGAATSVTVRVTVAGAAPSTVAQGIAATVGGASVTVGADATSAFISVPPGSIAAGGGPLTIANPLSLSDSSATVDVSTP